MRMLNRISRVLMLLPLLSCSDNKQKKQEQEPAKIRTENAIIIEHKTTSSSVSHQASTNIPIQKSDVFGKMPSSEDISKRAEEIVSLKNEIPPDGNYIFDISYAEYQGKTMGEKVLVVIKSTSITIISEGNPSMTAVKGQILDEGTLRKHNRTGDWLISNDKSDTDLEAYGDCVGDPMVIDFKNKVYKVC